jgi:cobalamin-dependent methionine synthase I
VGYELDVQDTLFLPRHIIFDTILLPLASQKERYNNQPLEMATATIETRNDVGLGGVGKEMVPSYV